jgi:hypothetical protein
MSKRVIQFLVILIVSLLSFIGANAQPKEKDQMVRLAKLVIDSAQLENYKAALKEEIET